jgi:DNA-binding PadR family transcriptional regulator
MHNIFSRSDIMPYESGPMTEAMYYVLLSLLRPNHGYQLMNEIEKVSKGRIKMGPGTLYGVLTRLLKDKLIIVVNDDGRRKTYSITEDGRKALEIEYERLISMVNDGKIIMEDRDE